MKAIGTIVEYNPLHNGHIYALNQIKKLSGADIIIAVCSGNFTMRGELSLFDKFEKTRQALLAGIDIVIELPSILTVQNSDRFAKNAVTLLKLAGVKEIWIGSEMNNPSLYEKCYTLWKEESSQKRIKELLDKGFSYKEATASILNLDSNDLLGFSYFKAIKEEKLDIKLKTIQRKGNYNSLEETEYPSAYAIRNNLSLMEKHCPSYLDITRIRNKELLFPYMKYKILSSKPNELKEILFVDEGIENKLKDISLFDNMEAFINHLSTKRYTKSRIQRMLFYILTNIKKQETTNLEISFLRILGYSLKGQAYLSSIKKETHLITHIKEGISPILDIEIRITKILDFIYHTSLFQKEQAKPLTLEG